MQKTVNLEDPAPLGPLSTARSIPNTGLKVASDRVELQKPKTKR